MSLVGLPLAKQQLRVSFTAEDTLIQQYLDQAEEAAAAFIRRRVFISQQTLDAAVLDGTAGTAPMVITPRFIGAVLLLTAHYYLNREATVASGLVELPLGVQDLLFDMRAELGV